MKLERGVSGSHCFLFRLWLKLIQASFSAFLPEIPGATIVMQVMLPLARFIWLPTGSSAFQLPTFCCCWFLCTVWFLWIYAFLFFFKGCLVLFQWSFQEGVQLSTCLICHCWLEIIEVSFHQRKPSKRGCTASSIE